MNRTAVINEVNDHFVRNFEILRDKDTCSPGIEIFSRFYEDNQEEIPINRFLELGCSTGYNLKYLNDRFGFECYGVEASDKAVSFANEQLIGGNTKIDIRHGFADQLPYKDGDFEAVSMGFFAYQVNRGLLLRTFSEMDRVLKVGGCA